MKKLILLTVWVTAPFAVVAEPGQYQINQACLAVGCFGGDNPATETVEITKNSGTFILTSDLTVSDAQNGQPVISVSATTNNSAVVIDLNGYQIRHNGIADTSTHGIAITGQNSVVTIRNGKIAAFEDGIKAAAGVTVVVENMVFRINRDDAIEAGMGIIRDSVFDANEFAINSTNPTASLSGDRLYVDSNLFIDDTAGQNTAFGFASSNYCKDNVIAYADAGGFGSCTLVGDNLCDTAACTVNRSAQTAKE